MSSSSPRRAGHADAGGVLDTNTVILLDRLTDASALREPAARAYDALIDGLTVRSVPHPDAADTA